MLLLTAPFGVSQFTRIHPPPPPINTHLSPSLFLIGTLKTITSLRFSPSSEEEIASHPSKKMAQFTIAKAFLIAAVLAVFSAVASAQPVSAPAPAPVTGSAFASPISAVVIVGSLLLSVSALLRH
ncbi:unnamed protein product [Cuscuta campestris]|uniref:Uncharacterized protein n=1 Tax=Cuscuta campestris TaxID=132261 RepID=A0A484MW56_9ASTE|nr:unnamed protein product [Cuscuta campestris]